MAWLWLSPSLELEWIVSATFSSIQSLGKERKLVCCLTWSSYCDRQSFKLRMSLGLLSHLCSSDWRSLCPREGSCLLCSECGQDWALPCVLPPRALTLFLVYSEDDFLPLPTLGLWLSCAPILCGPSFPVDSCFSLSWPENQRPRLVLVVNDRSLSMENLYLL